MHRNCTKLTLATLLLTALLTACGVAEPAAGPPPTPPPSEQAAQATGGPGSSDIVPTPPSLALSEADLAASATAQAAATPTPFTQAESETATALAQSIATPTPFTQAESESATAFAAGVIGTQPALVTRTPIVGMPELLPAPIYLRSSEPPQVIRVTPNLVDYAQITFEQQPVVELAVPARAGGIFYLIGDPDEAERTLVSLSGAGRRELLYGELSSLVVSPDGQSIFVRIDNPEPGLIIGQDESPAGIWRTTPDGLRPGLVLADEPADGVYDDIAPAWTYSPIAFSPDGSRLAVYAYDADGPGIPGGELVLLGDGLPVSGPTCCELPVWNADGTALYSAGGGPAPDTRYGLYRSDAATGEETAVVDGATSDTVPLVTAPWQRPDGRLFAYVELAASQGFSWEHPFRPALAEIGPDGALTFLAPPGEAPLEVLWSPDGAGAVLAALAPEYGRPDQLFWQPADGAPATLIPFAGGDMAWVEANAPLAAGDCSMFDPLAYRAGSEPSAAVFDVQGRLRSLGFDAGQPDGLYGEQTRAGVMAFQQARGLPVTGNLSCATWQAMLAQP